jgi:hypothetical protein
MVGNGHSKSRLPHHGSHMNLKTLALPIVLIMVVFIGMGDRFLPKPLNTMSFNTRNAINQTLTGLAPKLKPQKPNAETEKAVNALPH